MPTFRKKLSANDTGETESHQAGLAIPKTNPELLAFLPYLDPEKINPDCFITCIDENDERHRFRFIYYNGRVHGTSTRNEYRLTHTTGFIKENRAKEGDHFEISSNDDGTYAIRIVKAEGTEDPGSTPEFETNAAGQPVIRLTGWRKLY